MVIIFAIMYFLLFRPQRKEQQRHQEMLAAQEGDEIVTAGGIIGTVVHAEPDRVTIRSSEPRGS
jgi:preprotein translocase subunit YajC